MRRVLAVCDHFSPNRGGVERVVEEMGARMPARGFTVDVLTRRLASDAPGVEVVRGVRVTRAGSGPAPLPLEYWRYRGEARAVCARKLSGYDLVHAHTSFAALPLLGELARNGPALVATYYGPWHREYQEETRASSVPSRWPLGLRGLARPVVAALLRQAQLRVLHAASRLVVLSEHSRRELLLLGYNGAVEPELIPGGVDVERFVPRQRDGARRRLGLDGSPLLLSVRRLVPRMGLLELVEAVASLARAWPGIKLCIGGEGPLRDEIEERAERMDVGDRVRLLGRVAEEDLPWLYAAADLVVMPTRALEGFGLPVLEAWASGVPVVATPIGALPETVARLDPGLVAADASAGAIALAIERGLGLDEKAGVRARSLALEYCWERAADRMALVYEQASIRADARGGAPGVPEGSAASAGAQAGGAGR